MAMGVCDSPGLCICPGLNTLSTILGTGFMVGQGTMVRISTRYCYIVEVYRLGPT
jgi:hypothetical protein